MVRQVKILNSLAILCLIICALGVLAQGLVWHYSFYDLGIYSEALFRLRDWTDLNPFIPGRGIRIFNDHFDPILILIAPLSKLIPASLLGVIIDFLSIGLAWFPIQILRKNHYLSNEVASFIFIAWILNHAIQDALSWPFHPTTWGNLPLIYLFTFFILDRPWPTFLSFLILCLTREEFPLIGIPLSVVLYIKNHKRPAFASFLLTGFFLFFQYVLKPQMITGQHSEYGKTLIQSFLSNPLAPLKEMFSLSFFRMSLERYWPLILLVFLTKPKLRTRESLISLYVLSIGASIIGIRYASFQWGFHYGPAALAVFLFALTPHLKQGSFNLDQNKKWLKWGSLLLIAFSFSHSLRMFNIAHSKWGARTRNLNQAWQQIEALPVKNILASNNLAANIRWFSKKDVDVYILGGPKPSVPGVYDLVWIETPPGGDAWLIGHDKIKELITKLRKQSHLKIIQDDQYCFIAQGVISYE